MLVLCWYYVGTRLVLGWYYVGTRLVLGSNPEATTTATTEEFSQSMQVPSSTHPGTTYPVRAIPHSDKEIRFKYLGNCLSIPIVRRY